MPGAGHLRSDATPVEPEWSVGEDVPGKALANFRRGKGDFSLEHDTAIGTSAFGHRSFAPLFRIVTRAVPGSPESYVVEEFTANTSVVYEFHRDSAVSVHCSRS